MTDLNIVTIIGVLSLIIACALWVASKLGSKPDMLEIMEEELAHARQPYPPMPEYMRTHRDCEYCRVSISKTLAKCPHCGAPK